MMLTCKNSNILVTASVILRAVVLSIIAEISFPLNEVTYLCETGPSKAILARGIRAFLQNYQDIASYAWFLTFWSVGKLPVMVKSISCVCHTASIVRPIPMSTRQVLQSYALFSFPRTCRHACARICAIEQLQPAAPRWLVVGWWTLMVLWLVPNHTII